MKTRFCFLFLFWILVSHAQLEFQDNALLSGLNYSYGASTYGGGVSFCDFNGDGWDDLTYSTTNGEEVYFFINDKDGTFTKVDLGINDVYRTKQVLWVDYDNDGDKDFFATSISGLNKFYRNEGGLMFTDISNTCGLFTSNLYTYGASFGDIDADGDLDVFISNRDDITMNQYSYLYRNDSGTFTDITLVSGIYLGNQLSFCSAFFDYDNDGDQDLYVANDKRSNINRLYQNDGSGNFTDVSVSSGTGVGIDAMSTTIGDYDSDGDFDIYVTNTTAGNYHFKNNGDGTFTNVSSTAGTGFYSIGWGAVFLDADKDSHLDLYVSSSMDGTFPDRLTAAFYRNKGDNTFEIPESIGFQNDSKKSYGNAIGDFNNDGLPDIVVMNDTDNYFLWKNTTSNSNNWLKVKLQGVTNNRDGIGTKIEINAGGKSQYRYTLCGEGYLGQNSDSEFFGIGNATSIDYIKVTWLNGIIEYFYNVAPNQTFSIIEGTGTFSNSENSYDIINFYPNPARDIIHVSKLNEPIIISIIDRLGRIVKSEITVNPDKPFVKINNLSKGVYFIKSKNRGNIFSKRIIIE